MSYQNFVKYPTSKIDKGSFCDHCARFNSRHSTAEVIIVYKNEILLQKRARNPQQGWWCIPGGYVDWNETVEQAAIREVKEETGTKLNKINFLGVYSDINRDLDGRQNIAHCFFSELQEKSQINAPEIEVLESKWFPLDQLPENIAFDHRKMIEDYKKKIFTKSKEKKIEEHTFKKDLEKPWGHEIFFAHDENCTVKLLHVKAGNILSLQSHTRREEIWTCLSGSAYAIRGPIKDTVEGIKQNLSKTILTKGDVIKIPVSMVHTIEAIEDTDIIEVCYGGWEKDDITRYEDKYGRA